MNEKKEKLKPKHPTHAVRYSTNRVLGITRISFFRSLYRVSEPVYTDEHFRASAICGSLVKTWLDMGDREVSDRKAKAWVKRISKEVQGVQLS
jgi:hypothetical protein